MNPFILIVIGVYYAVGVIVLFRSWLNDFGEIGLAIALFIVLMGWFAWPVILVADFVVNSDCVIYRRKP